jgi:class 3 adenylate cyclase
MSFKFSSFDAMTRQNKIIALMSIKNGSCTKKEDYYLALHALLDNDLQVSLAAKMLLPSFNNQPWKEDLDKQPGSDLKEKVDLFLKNNIGFGPSLIETDKFPDRQKLAQELQLRQKKFESFQEWQGDFPATARILNSLRQDTQELIYSILQKNEKIERAYLCFYHKNLEPFKNCQRSLDSNTATTLVNLNRVHNPAHYSPLILSLFETLNRPIYLLAIISNKRCLLFMRDELRTSQAAVIGFNLQTISSIKTIKEHANINIEAEAPQDIIILPQIEPNDAYEASSLLREKSVEAIEAKEEFIERDFDDELKKLEMLFKARAIKNSEYLFRKTRLQKMELEKFSDANIEHLLAKRFSNEKLGQKFDEQLLKKFTFEKTIMFTDIVGFSTAASQKKLLDTMALLAVHDKMLMPIIEEFEGKLIKKIGDALMVRFDEPEQACEAALKMQKQLTEFNDKSDEKILIRIGINTGTVFIKNEDAFGDAVNLAARMESLARPGKIFITETTKNKVGNNISYVDVGLKKVKGKSEPIHVYTISDESGYGREMQELANKYGEQAGLSYIQNEPKTDNKSSKASKPAPPKDPTVEFNAFIKEARELYIKAVKEGAQRNAELEDWFARYEEFIKPRLELKITEKTACD